MKKVFTDSSAIAHAWANQTQDEARNSNNSFYFRNDTIYSYGSHFPIAKHINGKVLFTTRSYSNTTAKHIAITRAAIWRDIIFCYSPNATHEENLNSWKRTAEDIAANLIKAKKPEKYLSAIGNIKTQVEKYCSFFELVIPETLAILNIGNKEEFLSYKEKKESYELAEKKRVEKELKARHKKELTKWLKGESHRLYTHNGFDYLRITEERIETTQAVKIPLELGRRLYNSIVNNSLQVGAKVLDYEVKEIGKNIRIGCHNFERSYLLKFGANTFKPELI